MPRTDGSDPIAELEAQVMALAGEVMVGINQLVSACDEALELEAQISLLRATLGQEGPPSVLGMAMAELRERLASIDALSSMDAIAGASTEEFAASCQDLITRHVKRSAGMPGEGGG